MVRSWLRPPANCEKRIAVRLPKILMVLVGGKYHRLRRMCQCGDQLMANHPEVNVNDDDTFESPETGTQCDGELVPSYRESAKPNKESNQLSQRTYKDQWADV